MENNIMPEEGKSYVIVYDTFGEGLISGSNGTSDVEVFHSKEELDMGIVEAYHVAGDILDLDINDDSLELLENSKVSKLAIESLVICEVLNMGEYAKDVVTQYLDSEREKDYQTYLKLKERFEGPSC
mgnify:CR=1 FL=1